MFIGQGVEIDIDFGGMVHALPGLIWTTRPDGGSDFVNQRWSEYTGLTLNESLGDGWRTAIHPDDLAPFQEAWTVMQRSEGAREIDARLRRFDGEYRWHVFRSAPLRHADQHRCWLGLNADTGRAQADAALQSSEQELREALAQLTEGQHLSKTGSFTSDIRPDRQHWSDELYRIYEIDPATPPNIEAVRSRVHPDDLDVFNREIQRRLEGLESDFIFRIVTPQGGVKHLHAVARLMDQTAGRPIFMGVVQDITQSKLAEAALLASEAALRRTNLQLMEAHRLSRTGSFIWDVLADEYSWTEEVFRLFEFDPATKVSRRMLLETIHPEDLPAVQAFLEGAVKRSDFDLEFRLAPPSGAVKYARVIGRRLEQIADRPVFIGAVQDVTANKVATEALNRARSELAHVARIATLNAMTASIAHEVNQPLSGILNNANTCIRMLALDPPNLAGAAETARRTIRDAGRAAEVIKRLRAMFGNNAPLIEAVDLNDAVLEVIALSSSELQRSRVILQTRLAQPLPLVRGDRIQLQQVILNLLLNAADAMSAIEDRPRTLLVQTAVHGDDSVELLVRDSGVGLEPQVIEKLFNAFYTTKANGMGVGLSISRSIIDGHQGRLWATPNDGPGATFAFQIPHGLNEGLDGTLGA